MSLKSYIRKLALGEKASTKSYIDFLRKQGVKIGEDVSIYSPTNTLIDTSYPWQITIGNHVRITHGVIILAHDYSWSVLKNYSNKNLQIDEGAILGASGRVTIGDNVFIGMNSVITRNVNIGNNVIIGAGSVVTKDCKPDGVYAGNPAKRIMEIEDFYKKRLDAQLAEAKDLALSYYERYGEKPPEEVFFEYFMLFCSKDTCNNNPKFHSQMCKSGNENMSLVFLEKHKPMFNNYNDFLNECFK